jgi:hypothetical protein
LNGAKRQLAAPQVEKAWRFWKATLSILRVLMRKKN